MRRNLLKQAVAIISAITLLITISPAIYGEGAAPEGFERVCGNNRLILYANIKEAQIAVCDNSNSYIWYSCPVDRTVDKLAAGIQKMNLSSIVLVTYIDSGNQTFQSNNYTSCVKRNSFKYEKTGNGIRFIFDFSRKGEKFIIPVQFELDGDCLKADIISQEISEYGDYKIIDIALLPYFGAGGNKNEGYIFVPDGSGALINFNNGKSDSKEYEEDIYGRDLIYTNTVNNTVKQTVRMPVFGIKNGNNAYLAIAGNGECYGSINASVSGKVNSYNNVYCKFKYRARDTAVLAESDWSAKDVAIYSNEHFDIDAYQVCYYMLQGGKADYSGMAIRYRDILMTEKGLSRLENNKDLAFYAGIYGAVKKKKSILGINLNVVEPLTTFTDCIDIIRLLKEHGVEDIVVRYLGWMKGGLNDKVPAGMSPERKLGGRKGYDRLVNYAKVNDVKLYPDMDFMNIYKNGNGFLGYFSAARNVSKAPAIQHSYRLSTNMKNTDAPAWFLMAPEKLLSFMNRFLSSFQLPDNKNVSIGSLGGLVYSDFKSGKPVYRQRTMSIWEEALKSVKEKDMGIMSANGNAYTIPYVQRLVDVPVYSSRFDIEDEEIPFYQMVLHGLISYTTPPINLDSDNEMLVLKAIETGCAPYFLWTGCESSVLKETGFDYLYSSYYKDWLDMSVDTYLKLEEVWKETGNSLITSHAELKDDVYETCYENGVKVIVNYNEAGIRMYGELIPGRGYIVVNGQSEFAGGERQ